MAEKSENWPQGGSAAQIVEFSQRILQLTEHLKRHKHDYHSRRSLMVLIGKRKRHMKYLQRKNPGQYKEVIAKTGIRVSIS